MFELAFIEQCADPGVEIAIVERFVAAVGTDNPLAMSITSGNRTILPEPPRTPEEALRLTAHFVDKAVVRVGVTQYPAGYGISEATELSPGLFDACENIRMGSALFGKVYRIVAHARGEDATNIFADAVTAWRTGIFEGAYVFEQADPGPLSSEEDARAHKSSSDESLDEENPRMSQEQTKDHNPYDAGIRVDLSTIKEP